MFVVSVLEMREQASHPHMSLSTKSDRSSQPHNQQAIACFKAITSSLHLNF
ncbi:hypothetical protein [Nostoc sp. DSM 114161]|uniref:hypothetical protein n=1 Tax=Nostoc sp. DSM 114161 TaxID=3440143 RepID=UPI0040468571